MKTTIEIPEELWRKAKIRAVEDRSNLRALIVRGLELALAEKNKRA